MPLGPGHLPTVFARKRTAAHRLPDSCSPVTGQFVRRTVTRRTVAHRSSESCLPGNCPLDSCSPDICSLDSCLLDSCPPDSCSLDSCSPDVFPCLRDMCPLHSCSPDNCQLNVCPSSRHISRIFAPDSQLLTGQLIVICSFVHLLSTKADI